MIVFSKLDVKIPAEDGIELGAWLFLPRWSRSTPSHHNGAWLCGDQEHGLERFAKAFATAGFVVLLHDHRNFRDKAAANHVPTSIPRRQIKDWRRAISYIEARPEVDPNRIGLWGTSYAGGHAIVLGATDRRLRCIVAQVPRRSAAMSKDCGALLPMPCPRWSRPSATTKGRNCVARHRGGRPSSVPIPPFPPPIARRTPSISICSLSPPAFGKTRSRSGQRALHGCTSQAIGFPVCRQRLYCSVVARDDKLTVTDLTLQAYERALEPSASLSYLAVISTLISTNSRKRKLPQPHGSASISANRTSVFPNPHSPRAPLDRARFGTANSSNRNGDHND